MAETGRPRSRPRMTKKRVRLDAGFASPEVYDVLDAHEMWKGIEPAVLEE